MIPASNPQLPTEYDMLHLVQDARDYLHETMLFEGLILPEELQDITLIRAEETDFVQQIRLMNSTQGVSWDGLLLMFHKLYQRLFVEISRSGLVRICQTQSVSALFHRLPEVQWNLVYGNQTLLHMHAFSSSLQLISTDMFYQYDPDTTEIDICMSENDSSHVVHAREINRVLKLRYPLKLASYIFTANERWYLCNVQGPNPSCLILSFEEDRSGTLLQTQVLPLVVHSRDKQLFTFDSVLAFSPLMQAQQSQIFLGELTQLLLSGWRREMDGVFVPKMEPPAFVNGKFKLDESSKLGMHLLQYITLSVLPRTQRCAINKIQVELLYSELVFQRFKLQMAELSRKNVSTESILAFHGVRANHTTSAVNDIIEFGFNVKHAKHSLHGGGGIYCTQYFTCALQYVQHALGAGRNYVFVCLGLPGNSRSNGQKDEPMKPNQNSWFVNDPSVHPYTYFVIEQQGLLPGFLVTLD
jgi:hypothetical protein